PRSRDRNAPVGTGRACNGRACTRRKSDRRPTGRKRRLSLLILRGGMPVCACGSGVVKCGQLARGGIRRARRPPENAPAGRHAMMKTQRIPIAKIYVPVKRRATLDPKVVQEIAESMLEVGQKTPIQVREDGDRFVLVEGLHRLEACKQLGEE